MGPYDEPQLPKFATESLVYSIEEIVDTHTTEIALLEGRVAKLEDKIKIQNMAKEMLERIKILEDSR
jgi:Mg2+ and Co2+ transporter CorA